jgi:hypothetical protein
MFSVRWQPRSWRAIGALNRATNCCLQLSSCAERAHAIVENQGAAATQSNEQEAIAKRFSPINRQPSSELF